MTRIVLVEDHTLFRQSLVKTLASEPDLDVVGDAGRADEALGVVTVQQPDLVLLDIGLPGADGVELATALHRVCPDTKVVFLTMHDDELSIRRAMAAGADGFVPKTASSDELLAAVRVVAAGGTFLSPSVARRVANLIAGSSQRYSVRLTDRDLEMLELLAEGLRPAEVAQRMFLSVKTVKNYCSRVYAQLGARTATQAIAEAYRLGLLAPPARR